MRLESTMFQQQSEAPQSWFLRRLALGSRCEVITMHVDLDSWARRQVGESLVTKKVPKGP